MFCSCGTRERELLNLGYTSLENRIRTNYWRHFSFDRSFEMNK